MKLHAIHNFYDIIMSLIKNDQQGELMENNLKYILLDLDGTLLPMDQDVFVKSYFGRLAKKLAPHGYEPNELIASIWAGTKAMITNDGSCTNETAFWNKFSSIYGEEVRQNIPLFDEYYHNEFLGVKESCGYTPLAKTLIDTLKTKGYTLALATNPIFPAVATRNRIAWAGLKEEDFVLYTTYENARFCKPNLAYYQDILDALGAKPEECMMIGNDVGEDMVAQKLGMQVYLITDCLINKVDADISSFPHGTMEDLLQYITKEL